MLRRPTASTLQATPYTEIRERVWPVSRELKRLARPCLTLRKFYLRSAEVHDSSVGAEPRLMDHPLTRAESKGDIDLRPPRGGVREVGREAGINGEEILQNVRSVCGDEI